MAMEYNNKKHLKLLNYLLYYKKQNKNLQIEDPDADAELTQYQIYLQDHIFWSNRKKFVLLMKYFVDNSLELEQFEIDFSLLWWETMEEDNAVKLNLKRINNFHPNPRSYKFGSWITAIYRQFEELEDEYCTEREVKDYVRYVLQEIQPSL
jgi:hypothetical protein